MDITKYFKRFALIENSKNPTSEWSKTNKNFRIKDFNKNSGIPTGKINNIIVVDLDFYDKPEKNKFFIKKDSLFLKEFSKDYIKKFNTLTVETGNGGHHLFFVYDEDIKQTECSKHNIDIRSNGGYVVSAGSVVDGNKYKIINNTDIKEIPKKLKKWLLENIYTQKKVKKDKKGNIIKETHETIYKYNIDDEIVTQILEKIPSIYWSDYKQFLIYTTACKTLGCYEKWDKLNKTKPNYNLENNIKIWNGCNESYEYCINSILKSIKQMDILNYYKYKPIPENKTKPNIEINKEKLGYDFFDNKHNYIVKSDTGTGKTTSFKHYVKENNLNFISIVSRVSLGEEQSTSFSKFGLDSRFYKYQEKFEQGQNIVITVDSIMKLYNIDFSNYVVFLDEFNSLIEYLITSSTLNNTRTIVYTLFIKIINNCKQIIGTDADISDISLRFIDFTTKQIKFINNKYLHNNGVNASEISEYKQFIKQLKKEDKFLCCCDSKTQAELLKKELDDESIKLITSNTDEYINLDNHDKIIFSPKIIYGLDSSMVRPVYCYYKEHTIAPTGMVQQIARCRNITHLYYLFTKKQFKISEKTIQNVKEEVFNRNTAGCCYFKSMCGEIVNTQYLELLERFEYNNDCYNTNKFAHFIKILEDRGFKRTDKTMITKTKGTSPQDMKDLKEYKKATFDKNISWVKKINEILKIPDDKIDDYKELFIDRSLLEKHFNLSNVLFKNKDYMIDKLKDVEEFNSKKINTVKMKLFLLLDLKEKCGCKDIDDITVKKLLPNEESEKYFKEYNIIYRNRDKKDFKTKENIELYIRKMYNNLFNDIITSKKDRKTQRRVYNVNKDIFEETKTLYEYRQGKQLENECLFDDIELVEEPNDLDFMP